ncbi:Malonyl CoA-acyl carrier protein transacylase [Pseudonocardia sp. Ae717_Ps2]|uniref:type I polyketide synthase n=1 Tax=Pseudonocardia sp. Ae717_Ps2 TaxID=1885573 RepID=UPI00094B1E03|nr:type I polyketide synthase [Pseudonocardia sp. Ae717_Ps2]OLM31354.1 Malonyl CoA-acyl carrier protein transacylase [Pseudonocardia sp. Ae717_Ps2]
MSARCHLLGGTRVLTRCGDALLAAGATVRGVFSDDPLVEAWASGHGIPCRPASSDLVAALSAEPADFLFSIVNQQVLSPEVLALPAIAAVNFHDGPLPRYAGSNVAAWAVFDGAVRHAVTWHVMAEQVDAGAVLAERWFPVRPHATGLSLTWESTEAGIALFGEIVDDLARRSLPTPVDVAGRDRRFHPRSARMDDGLVHPGTPADRAERLGRAMDFGSFPNPLGIPAVLTGAGAVLCRQLRAAARDAHRAAPAVAAVLPSSITVSGTDADLVLSDFLAPDGSSLSGTAAAQRLGAVVGAPLPPVDAPRLAAVAATLDAARRHETWWRDRLDRIRPLPIAAGDFSAATAHYTRLPLALVPAAPEETAVVEQSLLRVLSRRTGSRSFDVAWSTAAAQESGRITSQLVVERVPVRWDDSDRHAFERACAEADERVGYVADLEIRAGLAPRPLGSDLPSFTRAALLRREHEQDASIDSDTEVALVSVAGTAPLLCVRATWLDGAAALELAEEVEEAARQALAGTEPAEHVVAVPTADPQEDPAPAPTVLDLFDAVVASRPNADAVRCGGRTLSYTELDRWGDAVAASLYEAGVGPGDVVGVLSDRGPDLLPALLGVLRCGAAFLPLDPGFPRERLQRYLEVAGAGPVLVDEACEGLGRELGEVRRIGPDDGRALAVPPVVRPGDLAYVLFTSGSTGEPKGVEIEHAALGNFLTGIAGVLGSAPGDRVLAHTTLAFDISLLELLLPLTTGGSVVLASRAEASDPARLSGLLADVVVAQATPSLWRILLDADWTPHPDLTVLSGGEALPRSVAEKLLGGRALWNLYGPTEATIWVSCARIDDPAVIGLGAALPGIGLHVLDDDLAPVAPGGTGQLHLSGAGLARGYVNRPDRTAEVFVRDPRSGARYYRTGDLVAVHPDGGLEWLGRVDAQVKVRGFRIEPGEIEAVLERHPSVGSAVVVATAFEGTGEPALTAYLTTRGDCDREDLVAALRRELPGYMIPAAFVPIERFPLTGNGKIDRARLPVPTRDTVLRAGVARPAVAPPAVEPVLPVETARPAGAVAAPAPADPVAVTGEVLGEVLGIGALGATDGFFDLGGNSITVVTAATALTRRLGTAVGPTDILATGTPARLAELLGLSGPSRGTADVVAGRSTPAPTAAHTPSPTTDTGERGVPSVPVHDRHAAVPPRETAADEPIAVVGMACRFPGAATPDEFWASLTAGHVSIGTAPVGHRGWGSLWSDDDPTTAGWLAGVELFDADRFGMSDREARRTDPLQRLLLTVTAEAVESAGHDPVSLGRRTGVFVGTIASDFGELVAAADGHADPHAATGSAMALLANRVSHVFDWTGPSFCLDTACSSSLVALHQAVLQLRARQSDAAVVAAANLILTPSKSRSFARNGMLSPRGRCRAFDEEADGYVRGEGAAAVVLKRYSDAVRDGDAVLAVVRGVAVNHTGASTGFLTAPNGPAQTEVVREALSAAGIGPHGMGYVEAHGTGTRLGDLVELEALGDALGPAAAGSVPIGSVKSNIGHLEPAAGLAGLIKTVLALQAGTVPGTPGIETPNARFRFENSPLFVPDRTVPWTGPRVAGVSSFGFGGVNAHAVLAAAPTAVHDDDVLGLLVLSAGSERALHRLAERFLMLLRSEHRPAIAALCATALRRRHGHHRFACVVDSAEQAEDKLMLFLTGNRDSRSSHTGVTNPTAATGTFSVTGVDRTDLDEAARRFVAGEHPVVTGPARTVRIPTVPLEERHLWMERPAAAPATITATARRGGPAHPGAALGAVGSLFGGLREREWTDLPEAEGHVVLGSRVLPGAAYPQKVVDLRGGLPLALQDMTFRAVVSPPTGLTGRLEDGAVRFRDDAGVLVCDARLLDTVPARPVVPAPSDGVPADVAAFHLDLERHGLHYGERFRCLHTLVVGDGVASGELARVGDGTAALEPTLIDGAFQVALAACGTSGLYVPFSVQRLAVYGPLPSRVTVHARRVDRGTGEDRTVTADITVSADGQVLLRAERVTWTRLTATEGTAPGSDATGSAADGPGPGGTTVPPRAPATNGAPAAGPVRDTGGGSRVPAGARDLGTAVAEWVARALEVDPAEIEPDRPLQDLGLDSMLAVSVAQDLRDRLGVALPMTLVLEVGTLDGLVRELAEVYGVTSAPGSVGDAGADGGAGTGGAAGSDRTPPPTPVDPPVAAPPDPAPPAPAPAARSTGQGPRGPVSDDRDLHDIAIIGVDGVFPGAGDVDRLWDVLVEGRDCLREVPADRWNLDEYYATDSTPGTVYLRRAGFVDDLEGFDASFFRVAPADAGWMDPQQRHLIQSAWRALEDAGLSGRTADTTVGVYVGASYQHYRDQVVGDVVQTAAGLGNHNAMLANRVSWFMDLHGPSMTIDTLCSSSLVALHTAVRSLREGECGIALVAGVHMALSPQYFQLGSRLRSFSPTGSSRAFDDGADGFVPGEGVVTVVLKPLRDALADGDPVHAVVTGTAVNHGGRAAGLTVPTTNAQRDVVDAALRDAGVSPDSISLVEAHGTGTGLGDPIEIDGLTRAWRRHTDRRQFCAIGSVKSNIGHLEPAAGLAGLVKILLALEHRTIPATLNLARPNDHIRFEDTPFFPVVAPLPWNRDERPRRAALSAFGMGGVNAHVIIEEPPARTAPLRPGERSDGSHLLRVTAPTEDGLRAVAAAYAGHLRARPADRVDDVARTANTGRAGHGLRLLLHARGRDGMVAALDSVAEGRGPVPARARRARTPVTFAFTGQGAQWPGMARELRRSEPICAAVLDECAAVLRGHLDVPLETLLEEDPLVGTDRAQPAIVATQVALVTLLRSWGVHPDAVVGHSVGELTAAWAAGVLDLPDLMRATALRGRLMASAPGPGAMAVVRGDVDTAREAIAAHPDLEIAADNGPGATTVAGPAVAMAAFLDSGTVRATALPVAHAFHSAAMAGVVGPFADHLAGLALQPPSIPFASTASGRLHTPGTATDPASYAGAVRAPVLFGPAAAELDARVPDEQDHVWWEIGPQPALLPLLRRIASPRDGRTRFRSTLRREEGTAPLHRALADHHDETDATLDPAAHHRGKPHVGVRIPTYPFARIRHSALPDASVVGAPGDGAAVAAGHPFLDGRSGGLAS